MDESKSNQVEHDEVTASRHTIDCSCVSSSNRKVALVTGSATGIGANIAIDLAANGYHVIVTGRNEDKLKKVVDECNEIATKASGLDGCKSSEHDLRSCRPSSATFFRSDLADSEQLDKLVQFVLCNFERLDVLVNNACWRGNYKHLLECNEAYDDFKQVMHLNVTVPLFLIQRCLIPLRSTMEWDPSHRDSKAVIINVSSIASQVVVPLHAYTISKACLSELSRQLAKSPTHSSLGVLSVTISPGPVLTDERPHHEKMSNLTLMNRIGTTQEISNLVLFAITNAQMFNGKELNIDGGYVTKQKLPLAH